MRNTRQFFRSLVLMLVIVCMLSVIGVANEITPKVTIRVDGMGQDVVEVAVKLLPGEYVRVELTAASGTGYEWKLGEEPKLARVIDKSGPEQLSPDKNIPGGPYRITYTLQAGEEPGNEGIRFILARSWEDKKLAAKTLTVAMTIDRLPDNKP